MKSNFRYVWMLCLWLMGISFLSAQTTQVKYLSGKGKDDGVLWDFFVTEGMKAGKWSKIPVPSNWELHGFGKYNYGFDKEEKKGKEKGLYKYTVTVDKAWKGRVINLVFEGVMTDAEVKVNGKSAGEIHQGSFYVFKYDVSKLLNYNKDNLLEVTVAKHSENKSVNAAEREADYWVFGGIYRPVYLEALPQSHIHRVSIDAKADGQFRTIVEKSGDADEIQVQLSDANGQPYGNVLSARFQGNKTELKGQFSNPDLWSSEFPHLYQAH